jgi:FdhE protein
MHESLIPQELVNFYQELSQVLIPEDVITYTPPPREVLNEGYKKGIPLIKLCPPKVKVFDFFFTVMKQIAAIIQKHHPDLSIEITEVEKALPDDATTQELFVSQAFIPGSNLLIHLKQPVSPEAFGFLLNHTVKLFMQQYGKIVASLYDFEQWQKGDCPICGGRPNLALFEKETGKRYLYCGMCEINWRFQRLGCPYCLNVESQFFTVDGERQEKYRVYFCDHCRGYLKTINCKNANDDEIDLFWEDINTVYLDILALQEGYLNKLEAS